MEQISRRGFLFSAASLIAGFGILPEAQGFDTSAARYLKLTGIVSPTSSSPSYTRLYGTKGPLSHYVEFWTASSHNGYNQPLSQLAYQTVDVYVPMTSPLYFSDYPVPPPAPLGALGEHLRTFPPGVRRTRPDLVGSDGSPVTLKRTQSRDNGHGPINGLAGTAKDGSHYDLSIQTGVVQSPGRVANTTANWIFCHAGFTKNSDPLVQLGLGYCPSNLLVTLFLLHENVQSVIGIDLKGLVLEPNKSVVGSASLTRNVTYYGNKFSSQTLNMQVTDSAPGMHLATTFDWGVMDAIAFFDPALAYLIGQLAQPPLTKPTALAALGSLDLNPAESQQEFVSAAVVLATPALAPLASALAESSYPGLATAARLVGWIMTSGFGKQNFADVLAANYITYQQWAAKQGAGSVKQTPWRTILSPDPDQGFAQQAIDGLFDQK